MTPVSPKIDSHLPTFNMHRHALFSLAVAVLVLAVCEAAEYYPRRRTCCGYAYGNDASSPCQDTDACVLRFPESGDLVSPQTNDSGTSATGEFCRVDLDSKRNPEAEGGSRVECLTFLRGKDLARAKGPPPFSIKPYAFQGEGLARTVPGLNLEIDPDVLRDGTLKARIMDTALCPSEAEADAIDEESLAELFPDCKPRCFETSQNLAERDGGAEAVLSFDCEVGFYISESQVKVTSNHTYQIDLCHQRSGEDEMKCFSEYFMMPDMEKMPNVLPLLDRKSLDDEKVNVWFKFGHQFLAAKKVAIYHRETADAKWTSLKSEEYYETVGEIKSLTLSDLDLEPGLYRVTLSVDDTDEITVAEFQKTPSDGVATRVVLLLALLVLIAVMLAYCYKRYYEVKATSVVVPNRLVEAERIQSKDVFIITNVDNKHHIDVVNAFGDYLKNHCAVGEVYFALDPRTGITSQDEHDPWKWAQETAKKMDSSDDSCLVFIGAPSSAMGICIYKDLPNNQAFVSTAYLKKMVDENRVAILNFPYSDADTIPNLVPPHVRAKPWHLPKDMNNFLCQLLDVKKRELCKCLPIPIVQPQVLPEGFQMSGGKEMLETVAILNAKADRHRAEVKAAAAGQAQGADSTISRNEYSGFSDSEDSKRLLRPKKRQPQENGSAASHKEGAQNGGVETGKQANGSVAYPVLPPADLDIEIEPGMLSLGSEEAQNRDRRVNPEFLA